MYLVEIRDKHVFVKRIVSRVRSTSRIIIMGDTWHVKRNVPLTVSMNEIEAVSEQHNKFYKQSFLLFVIIELQIIKKDIFYF